MIDRLLRAATASAITATLVLASGTPAMAGVVSLPPLATLDGEQADAATAPLSQAYQASGGGMVEGIVWWGFHGALSQGPAFDSFNVKLNGVGVSGALATEVLANGLSRYALDIDDLLLQPGQAGSLEIVNSSLDVEWYWQVSDPLSRTLSLALQGQPAIGVPEPGALPLVALALLACRLACGLAGAGQGSLRRSRPA